MFVRQPIVPLGPFEQWRALGEDAQAAAAMRLASEAAGPDDVPGAD